MKELSYYSSKIRGKTFFSNILQPTCNPLWLIRCNNYIFRKHDYFKNDIQDLFAFYKPLSVWERYPVWSSNPTKYFSHARVIVYKLSKLYSSKLLIVVKC